MPDSTVLGDELINNFFTKRKRLISGIFFNTIIPSSILFRTFGMPYRKNKSKRMYSIRDLFGDKRELI
ncbi:hypothetical protein LEP1GSC061_3190 [Leptospira wolffii serovar Khorat str. Khorat-H2]|nr:hypothetical protein LEP1GSC061_3190 [Leptospira wolffii serovar Khorat str. Khorat-H2]